MNVFQRKYHLLTAAHLAAANKMLTNIVIPTHLIPKPGAICLAQENFEQTGYPETIHKNR
ncbi:hypothetical protein SAMN04488128_102515 [Chitinophaga eiseniae]|uniref:Uncharacterized protein n=1 Tax=Chitinophaga eiseniae TaxID=634771 RepID=A0A1T4QQS0_9BACT|nr:hypothetical protein SAMN04488128_102515 [Chitinophaga eiseniae]